MQIQLDGWNPRAPLFFQPHGSFTGGTETCCLFHPWVDNDLHAFAGHTGLHGIFCLLQIHTGLAEILKTLREYLGTADTLHHDFRAAALYDNRVTEVDALQIKAADRTRLFRRVRYAHDLGKAGHIIGQTVRDLVKTCARLNIHILREAAVKLLALGGGAVMTIVELRLGIQNLPVLAAIKAGKPVFSEKPLANTAADGKEIVEAEMAGGKHLVQVGFMRRYDRGYRQVKELIDSGKFGAPMVIKCTHRADGVADDYTTAMAVTDTAIHEIDVLPWLVNDEWDEVQCIMPKTNSKVKNALKDPQIMIMKTKGGIINMLEVNVNCGFGYDINCEVVCENGVVNLPCPSFPTVRYANEVSTKIEDNWILRFIDSYDVEIQDWVDHALKGETGGSSAWDGYVASITADALVKSQTSGVPEKVVTGGTPDFYKK